MLKPDNQSLSFLDSLYRELLPNFSSSYFNVGCDETWELGQGWSKPLCEQKGKVRVYLDFLCGINELVSRHGRKMMFWGDIILHEPALIKELPHNLIALNWGYEADHDFDKECPLFAASNIAFYVCPGTSSWGSLTGRTGNCLANLANAAEHGLANKAIGYLNTDWGDRGHHQHLPISYPGILGGAAYSWCFQSNRHPDIRAAMNQFIFEDDTGNLGKSIDALGKVMDLIPRYTPNCTIFNRLLTWDLQSKREDMLKDLTVQNLSACIEQFDAIEQDLATACPRTADGELVKAEIRNNLAMARHGVRRGLAVIEGLTDLSQLRSELQNIIGDFEHLWLNRNRPGGLHESSGYLRNALETVGGFDK